MIHPKDKKPTMTREEVATMTLTPFILDLARRHAKSYLYKAGGDGEMDMIADRAKKEGVL
jgi:hypothetical protein